jgi:heterodisulfide reductase subunit B
VTVSARPHAYFPGCTLSTTGADYDASGRAVAEALGMPLAELQDWNCCGAAFPLSAENVMNFIAPARMLIRADQAGQDLVTLCAVCFNVLRRSDHFLHSHPEAAERLNAFVLEGSYTGGASVRHLLGVLRDEIGWPAIHARVTAPLAGLRLAPYYGCMLLRPADEIGLDDPESPHILHDLLAVLGATVIGFPRQAECCGSTLLVSAPQANDRLSAAVVESARQAGAQALITACPLCQFNLERAQEACALPQRLPVAYFTQAMAAAFGLTEHAGSLTVLREAA